jgi:hypothetical protein
MQHSMLGIRGAMSQRAPRRCVDSQLVCAETREVGRASRCGAQIRSFAAPLALLWLVACGSSAPAPAWQVVAQRLPSAVVSVWGTSASDVYLVGGDAGDGHGPIARHFDGMSWAHLDTGQIGNLWWVFGFPGGPVYMGGDGGTILRYQAGAFTRMPTPSDVGTVFGIWGATAGDVWAVGGSPGGANGAFAWRLQGDSWVAAAGFPTDLAMTDAIWKIYGRTATDAWMVGTNGKVVRWDGTSLTESKIGGESLFTVHADPTGFVAVGGGFGGGLVVENTGSGWHDASPAGAPGFIGVCLSAHGDYAVGQEGAVYQRDGDTWQKTNTGVHVEEQLHSVWIDPSGGVWAVGGQVLTLPLSNGIVLHQGVHIPEGL